jgi:hypothetical protein
VRGVVMEMSADRSGAWIVVCKFDPVRSGDGVAAKERGAEYTRN